MFSAWVLSEFQTKMLVHTGFPIVLSRDVCPLLNIESKWGRSVTCSHVASCGDSTQFTITLTIMQNEAPREQTQQAKLIPKGSRACAQRISEEPVSQVPRAAWWQGAQPRGNPRRPVISYGLSAHPARAWEGPAYFTEPRKRVALPSRDHLLPAQCQPCFPQNAMACLGVKKGSRISMGILKLPSRRGPFLPVGR